MAEIDDVAQLIRARLDELNTEQETLGRALGGLGGDSAHRRGRSSGLREPKTKPGRRGEASAKAGGKPRRGKARATRIPRAEREKAILLFLKANPSASAKEIGAGVGTTANYVNNILTGLRKQERLIRKEDGTQVEVKAGASKPRAAKAAARKRSNRKKQSSNSAGGKQGPGKRGVKRGSAKKAPGK